MSRDQQMKPIKSVLLREDSSFEDIVREFVEGLDERLATMQKAIQDNDLDELRKCAHQPKGCGGGYGYAVVTERAADLELHAKDNAMDACVADLKELKQLCSRVVIEPA